jgi:class 3 adenylate cyclase
MEANHKNYDFKASFARIDSYLDANEGVYEEVQEIPSREKLTYSNGFYIEHCTALFVDIRGSTGLATRYTRPRLAKIYRSYISEIVAVMNGASSCAEVNIVGDGVYGIFSTPYKSDIDDVFSRAAMTQSVIDVLNSKLTKREIEPIRCEIGIDYGRLLMVQAGNYGSGINEVVWMGSAVNGASHLSHYGNRDYFDRPLMVSSVVYSNLNDHNQSLLSYNTSRGCYHGHVINVAMNEWLQANS